WFSKRIDLGDHGEKNVLNEVIVIRIGAEQPPNQLIHLRGVGIEERGGPTLRITADQIHDGFGSGGFPGAVLRWRDRGLLSRKGKKSGASNHKEPKLTRFGGLPDSV